MIVVDEVYNAKEVAAMADIARRGVAMVATVHGTSLQTLLDNNTLNNLLGGKHEVRCETLVRSNWLVHGAIAMNTAIGVLHAPTPAQGFPETVKSMHSLPSREGVTGTDPKTPGSGSPLAPGGLAATLRGSPSRETSPEASDERAKPGTVSNGLHQLVSTLLLSSGC